MRKSSRLRQVVLFTAFGFATLQVASAAEHKDVAPAAKPKFRTEKVRGKVVWMGESLQRVFGISSSEESHQRTLAILTDKGHLFPLVEDLRGKSFRTDERLRNKSMELLVRRYDKHPMLQVLRVYEFKAGKKYEVDYWCDLCAIVMFEKGFCACCQDTNRLRHRLVNKNSNAEDDGATSAPRIEATN